jgi:hypothetical protein
MEPDRVAVERAVAEARSEAWKPSYKRAGKALPTDQFSYFLTLRFEAKGGTKVVRKAGWMTDSIDLLPPDLRRLQDALWAARAHHLARCRATSAPQTSPPAPR